MNKLAFLAAATAVLFGVETSAHWHGGGGHWGGNWGHNHGHWHGGGGHWGHHHHYPYYHHHHGGWNGGYYRSEENAARTATPIHIDSHHQPQTLPAHHNNLHNENQPRTTRTLAHLHNEIHQDDKVAITDDKNKLNRGRDKIDAARETTTTTTTVDKKVDLRATKPSFHAAEHLENDVKTHEEQITVEKHDKVQQKTDKNVPHHSEHHEDDSDSDYDLHHKPETPQPVPPSHH